MFRANQLSIGPNKGAVQPSRTLLLKQSVSRHFVLPKGRQWRGTDGCGNTLPSNEILGTHFVSIYCVYIIVLKIQILVVINISGKPITMLLLAYFP